MSRESERFDAQVFDALEDLDRPVSVEVLADYLYRAGVKARTSNRFHALIGDSLRRHMKNGQVHHPEGRKRLWALSPEPEPEPEPSQPEPGSFEETVLQQLSEIKELVRELRVNKPAIDLSDFHL